MSIITVDVNKCIGCNACVRVCPVHANKTYKKEGTSDEFVTTVVPDACINCGECVKACHHGARGYNDGIDMFADYFENKRPMNIIVAPAVRTSFPNGQWKQVLQFIRDNCDCKIYDVGFGADICTFMYNKYIKSNPNKKVITQPCPAIVNFICKYHPELIPNLSPVMSPVGCLAVWLKKYKNDLVKTFMLSPCIAKTSEALREGSYDYNVTFKSLEKYLKRKHFDFDDTLIPQFKFDEMEGSIGRIYPMPGGLKETMLTLNQDLVIRTSEGPHTVYDRLIRYSQTDEERKPDILDVLNCEFGCNHGTALPDTAADLLEIEATMDRISSDSMREVAGSFLGIGRLKRFKEFEKTLKLSDFLVSYEDKSIRQIKMGPDEYDAVFESMNKHTPQSRTINCTACGYKSCKDMAYAIYNGLNVKENCVYYLKQQLKEDIRKMQEFYS